MRTEDIKPSDPIVACPYCEIQKSRCPDCNNNGHLVQFEYSNGRIHQYGLDEVERCVGCKRLMLLDQVTQIDDQWVCETCMDIDKE